MAGGKKRKLINKKSKPRNQRPNRNSSSSLFVVGGILSDFNSPFSAAVASSRRGKYSTLKSGRRPRNPDRADASGFKDAFREPGGRGRNVFRFDYSSAGTQGPLQFESNLEHKNAHNLSFRSDPNHILLLDSNDSKVIVFEEQGQPKEGFMVEYNYHYGLDFELGESSHHGVCFHETEGSPRSDEVSAGDAKEEQSHRSLGYSSEPGFVKLSNGAIEEEYPLRGLGHSEGEGLNLGSSRNDMEEDEVVDDCLPSNAELDASVSNGDEGDWKMVQEFLENPSPQKNSGFLSIGGMRLYTEDITSGGSDDGIDKELCVEGSSSDDSDGDSDDSVESGSDIDDEIVADYMEGIGRSGEIFDAKWLTKLDMDASRDIDDGDGEVLEKLGGVALEEASREHRGAKGIKLQKKQSVTSKNPIGPNYMWSSAMDDLVLVKAPRRLFKKKKHVADNSPGSWPRSSRKSNSFRSFSGEKKKLHKELIDVKRKQTMTGRGVDLEQINAKLMHMVSQKLDILSFHPMDSRDCAQVQKMAAIYHLHSARQGSGRKRFVTVTKTQRTSMPSTDNEIRLGKLLGGKDNADFLTSETLKATGESAQFNKKSKCRSSRKEYEKHGGKKDATVCDNQPVAFVSSGVMQSKTLVSTIIMNSTNTGNSSLLNDKSVAQSTKFGAFESHTKGFGSKMMAKMGYVNGGGLGKDGLGRAEPIAVIKRPKSLGLGIEFSESSDVPEKESKRKELIVVGSVQKHHHGRRQEPSRVGEFEKHTKGFGSKMMARMGFIEGMGLGRDSQGMVNPIFAAKRPKARGLGAEK